MQRYNGMRYMLVPGAMVPLISRIDAIKSYIERLKIDKETTFENMNRAAMMMLKKRTDKKNSWYRAELGYSGFYRALMEVWSKHDNLYFNVETILAIYRIMIDDGEGVSTFREGTENDIKVLADNYAIVKREPEVHPLFLISSVVYDFLCVSPFTEGNEEIAEILMDFLLLDCGYCMVKYCQLEREGIRPVLQQVQALRGSSQQQALNSFTMGFLCWVEICYKKLEERVFRCETIYLSKKELTKKERVEKLLRESSTPLTKMDISVKLPDVSVTTIEICLANLCKARKIERKGARKTATYTWIGEEN